MSSCHRKAANTARRLSAIDGLKAIFTVCLNHIINYTIIIVVEMFRRRYFQPCAANYIVLDFSLLVGIAQRFK